MRTLTDFLSLRPSATLYHYTDSLGILGILNERAFWATNVHHLNDAHEYIRAASLIKEEMERRLQDERLDSETEKMLKGMTEDQQFDRKDSSYGVVSFSTNGNQLSQWRAYCPKGNGYSLGFSFQDLLMLAERLEPFW